MFKKKGSFSWALLFGHAMHQMLDRYYKDQYAKECQIPAFEFEDDVILRPDQTDDHRYWQMLLEVMFDRYIKYWDSEDAKMVVEATEQEVEYNYEGFRLRGKLDMVFRPSKKDGIFILDHKTTYDINESLVLGWQFRFQFLFYAWLYWKISKQYPAGVYVNALKKPLERRSVKKQESVEEFIKRIELNMQIEPEKYFKRFRLPIDKSTLARFEKYTLKPLLFGFKTVSGLSQLTPREFEEQQISDDDINAQFLTANTDHCHVYNKPCEFLELCQNNFDDFANEYIAMPFKHAELTK